MNAPAPETSRSHLTPGPDRDGPASANLSSELAVSSTEDRLRLQSAALEHAANAVLITDARGSILWTNPAFTKLTGYTLAEVAGQTPRILKSGKHDPAFYRDFWNTILAGQTWRGEFVNRRKDGSLFHDEHTITPVRSSDGQITHFVGILHDVSERKKLEAEIKLWESQLGSFFSGAAAGLAILDPGLRYVRVNGTLAEMHGIAAEDHIGKTIAEVVPHLAPELVPLLEQVLATCEAILNFELTGETPHEPGVQRHWIESFFPICGLDGRPQGVGAIVVEITERKRAEEALAAEVTRWKTLMQMSTDSIHLLDADGQLLEANEAFFRGLGYSAEEGKGLHVADWDAQWTREQLKQRLRAMLDSSEMFETRHRRKDGSIFEVEAGVACVRIKGKPLFFCITRDITERKRADAALRESEERYRKLVELSPDAIYVHCQGRFVLLNKVACAMFGAARAAELIGASILDRVHPDFHAVVQDRIRTIQDERLNVPALEEKLVRLDGTIFDAEVAAAPFVYQGKPAALVIVRDITEKKILEEKSLRNQRLESLGTLAGGIAHDLNNVLAPILMSLEILQSKLTDESSRKILSTIGSSAQRGSELVKQILAFSRGMSGERVAVQLRHVVREMQGIIRQTFPKSITMLVQMASDLGTVNGDATQLHQVLMNLCVNARDAMPQGGNLTVQGENLMIDDVFARMHPEAKAGPYVVLTVADNGTGMPPEVQRRIFEPFFTTKEPGKGTGLGLSTVHTIVKHHGGFVNVYSEIGLGTTFKVFLPAERSAETRSAQTERVPKPAGHGELILIADDEFAIQQIAQETLQMAGYRVFTASNGAEAVALCAKHAPEVKLLLTDMMMPVMDGAATMRAVRILAPKVKVIAASGMESENKGNDPQTLNADAFLTKPFTAEMLLRTVAEILGG